MHLKRVNLKTLSKLTIRPFLRDVRVSMEQHSGQGRPRSVDFCRREELVRSASTGVCSGIGLRIPVLGVQRK
jgi:hypothetical protein